MLESNMNQNRRTLSCIVIATLVMLGSPVAIAEGDWGEEGRNELGLYLGWTASGSEGGFSVGIDYEHRLNQRFGIGCTVEHTGSDFRENIIAISFNWHPWKELKLFAAPGLEIEDDETGALLRLGFEYGFGIGKGFEIAPGVAFDFTEDEHATVIGAVISRKF
jgi:hypothetical protein